MNGSVGTIAQTVRLRLSVVSPPAGVQWAVQLGRADLMPPVRATRDRVDFEIPLEIVPSSTGKARLRGAAVQGPSGARFVYVNSGSRAGEAASCWDRRAKVSLEGIAVGELRRQAAGTDVILEGEIRGTAKDGGPACASVPLLREAWVLARRTD